MMFFIEYSISGRAACQVCSMKIAKDELRIGKTVMLEAPISRPGKVWHHYRCFWLLQEPNKVWSSFTGTSSLRLEDQQSLYIKVTGHPMNQQMTEQVKRRKQEIDALLEEEKEKVERSKEESKANALSELTNISPEMLIRNMIKKHVDILKVPELKKACKEHSIKLDSKAKRADIVKVIMDQKIEKVSGLAYHGLKKNLTIPQIKEILKNVGIAASGTKEDLLRRLLESQGADLPDTALMTASQATPKEKKRKWSFDEDDEEDIKIQAKMLRFVNNMTHRKLVQNQNKRKTSIQSGGRKIHDVMVPPPNSLNPVVNGGKCLCGNPSAKQCAQRQCGTCCSGPCSRHRK